MPASVCAQATVNTRPAAATRDAHLFNITTPPDEFRTTPAVFTSIERTKRSSGELVRATPELSNKVKERIRMSPARGQDRLRDVRGPLAGRADGLLRFSHDSCPLRP